MFLGFKASMQKSNGFLHIRIKLKNKIKKNPFIIAIKQNIEKLNKKYMSSLLITAKYCREK